MPGHTYAHMLVHVVFSTKQRRPLVQEAFRARLYEYMAGVAREEFGEAWQIGGIEDHLHALLQLRADTALADAMRVWKSVSSKWVNETVRPRVRFAWQTGYAAFSVSQSNVERVRRYIVGQRAHHRRQSFQEEFVGLLKRHGVEYDPRYLWD